MERLLRHSGTGPEGIYAGQGPLNGTGFNGDALRYRWKKVNFSRFLYDSQEDIYIPEEVFLELAGKS
ncbi:MAG: hypothetical protein ACE14T_06160 [Syntrophales bacterium]